MTSKIKYGIYLIQNIVNNKRYIGSTNSGWGFIKRWRQHKTELRGDYHANPHLQHAYNKYGENKFQFVILEECPDNILVRREQFWINYYQTNNSKYGYNLRGAGSRGKISEETRKRMSEAGKQKIFSKEHREKISKSLIGNNRRKGFITLSETLKKLSESHMGNTANLGRCFSETWRANLSKSLKGIKRSEEYKRKMSKIKKEYYRKKKQNE